MDSERESVIGSLMPVSAYLDDFLAKYEYIDDSNPNMVPELLDLMNRIQKYVNGVYTILRVTVEEWEDISERVLTNVRTSDDEGLAGFGKDDSSPEDDDGQPVEV